MRLATVASGAGLVGSCLGAVAGVALVSAAVDVTGGCGTADGTLLETPTERVLSNLAGGVLICCLAQPAQRVMPSAGADRDNFFKT